MAFSWRFSFITLGLSFLLAKQFECLGKREKQNIFSVPFYFKWNNWNDYLSFIIQKVSSRVWHWIKFWIHFLKHLTWNINVCLVSENCFSPQSESKGKLVSAPLNVFHWFYLFSCIAMWFPQLLRKIYSWKFSPAHQW